MARFDAATFVLTAVAGAMGYSAYKDANRWPFDAPRGPKRRGQQGTRFGSRNAQLPRTYFWKLPARVPWPFAANSPRHPGLKYVGGAGQVHMLMKPVEALALTGSTLRHSKIFLGPDATLLAEKMRDGETPIPYLIIEEDQHKRGSLLVSGHEGRHRIYAARLLGVKQVPVILIFRAPHQHGFGKWDEWVHGKIEDYAPVKDLLAGRSITIIPQNYGKGQAKRWGNLPTGVEVRRR